MVEEKIFPFDFLPNSSVADYISNNCGMDHKWHVVGNNVNIPYRGSSSCRCLSRRSLLPSMCWLMKS